ncbi:MAG: 50S ribosomal protein L6 [Candidatus Aenigmatarchaeota archaeon]
MRYHIIEESINIPENVNIEIKENKIIVSGPKGKVERRIEHPKIYITIENNILILKAYFATRREAKHLYTLASHIKNAINGVLHGFQYKLKAVYVHFPFKMKIQNNKFIIENFLGERKNRELEIPEGVNVKIEGDIVIVEGVDIEIVGNFASRLEALTKIKEKDLRKFQDGLYIIEKP